MTATLHRTCDVRCTESAAVICCASGTAPSSRRNRAEAARGETRRIAGFAHVAVGLVSGRLVAESSRVRPVVAVAGPLLLALLPDIDTFWCALGVPDVGLGGHRGITHTPAFALAVGVACGLTAWLFRWGRSPWRVALVAAVVVLSHCALDALAQEGRGIMALWPFSTERQHFPWRPIPDAPAGLAFFSRKGMVGFFIELIYFAPLTIYALSRRGQNSAAEH
jgi:inner membrane protein